MKVAIPHLDLIAPSTPFRGSFMRFSRGSRPVAASTWTRDAPRHGVADATAGQQVRGHRRKFAALGNKHSSWALTGF